MALPLGPLGERVTDPALVSQFVPPYDLEYNPLEEIVLGGTALGDGQAGREVQAWVIFYEGGSIKIAPEGGAVAFSMAVAGVTSVSLAFDSNMSQSIAYQTAAGAHIYRFDSIASTFITTLIPGATSCRAGVDDLRFFNSAASDVIFAYTLDNVLYYRQQRDRHAVEYTIGPSHGLTLMRVAPTVLHRCQFKLGSYSPYAA